MTKISRAYRRGFSVSKNLFDTLIGCQKGSEDEQLTPVGVYRYGIPARGTPHP